MGSYLEFWGSSGEEHFPKFVVILECLLIGGRIKVIRCDFLSHLDSNGNESKVSLFSDTGFDEIRRRAKFITDHGQWVVVSGDFTLASHELEHVDRLGVKRSNRGLSGLDVTSVASARRSHPQDATTLLQLLQHTTHGRKILAILDSLGLWIRINVLFGMDANEISPHGKRNGCFNEREKKHCEKVEQNDNNDTKNKSKYSHSPSGSVVTLCPAT